MVGRGSKRTAPPLCPRQIDPDLASITRMLTRSFLFLQQLSGLNGSTIDTNSPPQLPKLRKAIPRHPHVLAHLWRHTGLSAKQEGVRPEPAPEHTCHQPGNALNG